eukprot:scpid102459/ scgid8132/ 
MQPYRTINTQMTKGEHTDCKQCVSKRILTEYTVPHIHTLGTPLHLGILNIFAGAGTSSSGYQSSWSDSDSESLLPPPTGCKGLSGAISGQDMFAMAGGPIGHA